MSIIDTLENAGKSALTAVEHAAAWLVGKAAQADASLHQLEADSPLVAEAIAAGKAAAESHGVPVDAIENAGLAVLGAAKNLAANLTKTASPVPSIPPVPPPAPAGSPDPSTGAGPG